MISVFTVFVVAAALFPTLPAETAQAGAGTSSLQQALAEKGFYRGPIDGVYNTQTRYAVMAFRKEIGTTRSYSWSDSLWDDLIMYQAPYTRFSEPDRVEINLTKQTAHLFRDGQLMGTFPISSGNGELFYNSRGKLVRAVTPAGSYRVFRRAHGWYTSYLGQLLNPWFFNGGIALHGSNTVPSYPDSHGCVRLTVWDSNFVNQYMYIGIDVHVYRSSEGPVYGSDGPFADVPSGHLFITEIQWMVDNGYTSGCRDYFYCDDDPVTRGQMAAFLRRVLDLSRTDVDYFTDDGSSIFESDVNAIAHVGITKGCNPPANDRYCSDRTVSRGEMAALIRRAFNLPYTATDYFGDDDGHLFENDINSIAAAGITKGCSTGYCPDEIVTRGAMAAFLYRAAGP